MSEKVKLPKQVCDTLDYLKEMHSISEIFIFYNKKDFINQEAIRLYKIEADLLMRALVIGYEPELSPEEQLKFMLTKKHNKNIDYKSGAWYALKIHGIKYDWLEEYAE
jgi:hypothetical protein